MLNFRLRCIIFVLIFGFISLLYYWINYLDKNAAEFNSLHSLNQKLNSLSPLIFIGGVPRSGTTLMRAMLDAHPSVRCGEETRVIPRVLSFHSQWKNNQKEWQRLQEAGVKDSVINSAISAFILEIIAGHGPSADRLCNKDPFTLKSTSYLLELFPNAKFILMLRDGRATVNSIISRKVTITGFDLNNFRQCLTKWNSNIKIMYDQCLLVGKFHCMMIYYEQLVLHPEQEMRKLLLFLDLPWNSSVLSHEKHIGSAISLSKTERSSDQVIKPINLDALNKWVGKIPNDVIEDMDNIAPMLEVLGYDPHANPPNYGKPDDSVIRKTDDVHKNSKKWYKKAIDVVNDPNRVDLP